MVTTAGAVNPEEVASSVSDVVNDEGTISNYRYENLEQRRRDPTSQEMKGTCR